ncbi:hypothetical protein, partial [Plasmodium yoelii yoelii]
LLNKMFHQIKKYIMICIIQYNAGLTNLI